MMQPSDKLWSHRFAGMQPQIYAVGARVFVQLSDWDPDRFGDKQQTLRGLDTEGRLLWSLRDAELRSILDDGCVVDSPGHGDLRRIDGLGQVTHRVGGAFIEVASVGDRLLLRENGGKVQMTDLAFKRIRRLRRANSVLQPKCCRRGEHLYVISKEGVISRFDRRGKRDAFAKISAKTIEQTIADFERTSGRSALEGWIAREGEPTRVFKRGDRIDIHYWCLSYDPEADLFFATHIMMPHLLVCIEPGGGLRWSRYIAAGCCAGKPRRLSNGSWVASSGCSGVLSWIEESGEIVHRSERRGEGSLLGSDVEVVDGDVVLVTGGGLCAYDSGALIWNLDDVYSFAVSDDLLTTVAELDDEVELSAYRI